MNSYGHPAGYPPGSLDPGFGSPGYGNPGYGNSGYGNTGYRNPNGQTTEKVIEIHSRNHPDKVIEVDKNPYTGSSEVYYNGRRKHCNLM